MRENKSMRSLLAWVFRLSIPVYVYLVFSGYLKSGINLSDLKDVFSLAFGIMAILLFFGAFSKREGLTKVSAIVIILVAIIAIFRGFVFTQLFFLLIVPFYFAVYGNRY